MFLGPMTLIMCLKYVNCLKYPLLTPFSDLLDFDLRSSDDEETEDAKFTQVNNGLQSRKIKLFIRKVWLVAHGSFHCGPTTISRQVAQNIYVWIFSN